MSESNKSQIRIFFSLLKIFRYRFFRYIRENQLIAYEDVVLMSYLPETELDSSGNRFEIITW